jgi:diguanylate cyclase (GGDEF)-like protein
MTRLTDALARSRSLTDHRVSVLFIDLDRFKFINDSLGHLAGDELLIKISEKLRECLRPRDTVARLGGDEFVVLVEGDHDGVEVLQIAERIQRKFRSPFYIRENEVYSSASIGILHASSAHLTSEDMMRDADTAMYQAKKAGKARHEVFDEKMHTEAIETLQLETDLRRAVERDEFVVCYQPIFSLVTGEVEGVEALARWQHPKHGSVPPNRFISLAEEIGMIDRLGNLILKRACTEMRLLERALTLDYPLFLSVNLSCRQFGKSSLVPSIKKILDDTSFSPRNLRLEITESVFFEYQDTAVQMLSQLSSMGIELNVDDFGTGYSNLSYLMRLPISTLKIDKSFVKMIGRSAEDTGLVRAIVSLARTLGLKVVAEGVETPDQLRELERLRCDGAQGYLFAEPMSAAGLQAFLSRGGSSVYALPTIAGDISPTAPTLAVTS